MKGFKKVNKSNQNLKTSNESGENVKKTIKEATQFFISKRYKDAEKILLI